jgi:hypothetical protein
MRREQKGVTAIGFIIIAAFLGLFAFAILRLTPIYLEQMKIASILNDVKVNLDNQNTSVPQIKSAIEKRLDVEMVTGLVAKDFKITKTSNGYMIDAAYEKRAHYVANLYLVVVFDRSVEIIR